MPQYMHVIWQADCANSCLKFRTRTPSMHDYTVIHQQIYGRRSEREVMCYFGLWGVTSHWLHCYRTRCFDVWYSLLSWRMPVVFGLGQWQVAYDQLNKTFSYYYKWKIRRTGCCSYNNYIHYAIVYHVYHYANKDCIHSCYTHTYSIVPIFRELFCVTSMWVNLCGSSWFQFQTV